MIDKDWNIKKEKSDINSIYYYSQDSIDKLKSALFQDIDYYASKFDKRVFEPYFIKRLIEDRIG